MRLAGFRTVVAGQRPTLKNTLHHKEVFILTQLTKKLSVLGWVTCSMSLLPRKTEVITCNELLRF